MEGMIAWLRFLEAFQLSGDQENVAAAATLEQCHWFWGRWATMMEGVTSRDLGAKRAVACHRTKHRENLPPLDSWYGILSFFGNGMITRV